MIKIRLVDTPEDADPCISCVLSALTCDDYPCGGIDRKHFEFVDPETIELFQIVKYEPIKVETNTINEGLIRSHFGINKKGKPYENPLIAGAMAYEAIFHGYRAIVMNLPFANSQVFKSVYDPDRHDIMVLFGIKNGEVKYTLFCDKPEIDVSEIAKQYGGGGHRGAAGFYSEGIIL